MDLVFLFKCMMDLTTWICLLILSNYHPRHANYQLKIRYARTNVLKFSYFSRVAKAQNS